MDYIIDEFYKKIANIKFEPYGILDSSDKIHTLGTDSKIIGRIFEMFTQPILEDIAKSHEMILRTPRSQTAYPDFIMMDSEESKKKIAIDIKTTYVESDSSNIKFTLGSYASYMRSNTKNIEYKYTDYIKHYIIGFVYKRNDLAQESRVYDYLEKAAIEFPYYDVKCFMQEKYKVAGDKPGSGNTENIGSFSTKDFSDLQNGNGPFSKLGVDTFDLYWKYYPEYRSQEKSYTSLSEFIEWVPKHINDIELLHPFDRKGFLNRICAYKKVMPQKGNKE